MDGTGIRGVVADRWWLRFGTVVAGSETKEKGRSQKGSKGSDGERDDGCLLRTWAK